MPFVNIKVSNEGVPTREQKAEIIEGVTELLTRILNKKSSTVVVIIEEVDMDNWGVGGETLSMRRALKGQ